jgi:uncharacterized protein (DUF2235 family)
MARNIILLLDGTSNEIETDRSNILRLYGTLDKGADQLVWYDPGVGTFGAPNTWSLAWRRLTELWGQLTGWGLDQNVKDAYQFLITHYDDGWRADGNHVPPDAIYIVGFSRGAYTARVLAGFINAVGLIHPTNAHLTDYAYRAYKGIGERNDPDSSAFAEVRLYVRFLQPTRPAIRALALFDTVASVIEPGRFIPRLRSHAFTRVNPSVECVRHAVSIDERRTLFSPQLWTLDQPCGGPFPSPHAPRQDTKEVWFSGVHGDVGGGYSEPESHLAKIPLLWMIEELRGLGLRFKAPVVESVVKGAKGRYAKPDPLAAPHRSLHGLWSFPGAAARPAAPARPCPSGCSCRSAVAAAFPTAPRSTTRFWRAAAPRRTTPSPTFPQMPPSSPIRRTIRTRPRWPERRSPGRSETQPQRFSPQTTVPSPDVTGYSAHVAVYLTQRRTLSAARTDRPVAVRTAPAPHKMEQTDDRHGQDPAQARGP